jgi:hypothetical protein
VDTETITIVSGLPRSGTSMMMRMVAAAGIPPLTDNLRPADLDNPHGYFEFEPVKRTKQDPSWLGQAGGRVVKMVHLLLADLPPTGRYRIILMQRELDEVVTSQATMLARAGTSPATPDVLKKVFGTQLEAVRKALDARPEVRWIEASYNRILADPTGEASRIADFLGRPDAADAMAAAVDPALYRSRPSPRTT